MKIVFLTGAGISVESGLPTFRGDGGLWTEKECRYYASVEGFYHEPEKSLEFYNWRRKKLSEVEPNQAHLLIAELENEHQVTVITQNVDNLHERAGSSHVIHLHGELSKVCSQAHPQDPKYIMEYPLTTPIKVGDSVGDGAQMRPFTVLFGERTMFLEESQEEIVHADLFVLVGTSLAVYPAAGLIGYAYKDIHRFVIDPDKIEACEALGFEHIQASASEGMQILLERIKTL